MSVLPYHFCCTELSLLFLFQNHSLLQYGRPQGDGEIRITTLDKRARQDRWCHDFWCLLLKCLWSNSLCVFEVSSLILGSASISLCTHRHHHLFSKWICEEVMYGKLAIALSCKIIYVSSKSTFSVSCFDIQ